MARRLSRAGVEIRCDKKALTLVDDAIPAIEPDWSKEYLDLIIAMKVVENLDEAIPYQPVRLSPLDAIVTENKAMVNDSYGRSIRPPCM